MLELPHTIVGAAIASKVGNPALALPLALASHFVLDMLPHWNPHIYTELKKHGSLSGKTRLIILADAGLSLVVGTLIAVQAFPSTTGVFTILLGAFMGILPDVIEIPYYFLKWRPGWMVDYVQTLRKLQINVSAFWGITTQVAIAFVGLWWAFQK